METATKGASRPRPARLSRQSRARSPTRQLMRLSVSAIQPAAKQPRTEFDAIKEAELGQSMIDVGQLAPIGVRPNGEGRYELIYGERRWRGAQRARIAELDAWVYDQNVDPLAVMLLQVTENVQRESMTPYERAAAYKELADHLGSAEAVAVAVSVSPANISKHLALLKLPASFREILTRGASIDVETLATLATVEKRDAQAFAAIVKDFKRTGVLSRATVRAAAKTSKLTAARKQSAQHAAANVKVAYVPVPAELNAGDRLNVMLRIARAEAGYDDARRFKAASREHGAARLWLFGTLPRDTSQCWVLFGEKAKPKPSDTSARLQTFPCKSLRLAGVWAGQSGRK